MGDSDKNTVRACIIDALHKYNREYPNNAINLNKGSSDELEIFLKSTNEHSNLVFTVLLFDKTTGEPVENMNLSHTFDGYGEEVTYDIVSEMYDIKLALIEQNNYSYEPTILGNFYEKLVELRNSMDISNYLRLPTPEEFGRLLDVSVEDYSYNTKVAIKLLTEEERTEVRKYIEMNTSSNVPPDTPYMYALDLFCHSSTLNGMRHVFCHILGSYSKGYIDSVGTFYFGRSGCGDNENVTYIHSTVELIPSNFSSLYTYFTTYHDFDQSTGTVVMPQTFKLIQSKEGIDRRL